MTLDEIERLVRGLLDGALAGAPAARPQREGTSPEDAARAVGLVNIDLVREAARNGGTIHIRPGAIVTPLAREEAEKHGVTLAPISPVAALPRAAPGAGAARPVNPRSVALASDHGGFELKQLLLGHVRALGYQVSDLGCHSEDSVDYPDLAHKVALAVARGEAARGIVVDGVGIGSAMTANKVPGIRAANCHNQFEVVNSREHNDANVLCLGGRTIGSELAKAMVGTWLATDFGGGRHQRRVDKIVAVEQSYLGR